MTVWRFVVLLGLVSFLGDTTYEGARSILGPYLALLGAGASVVGIISGLGELIGYAFRLVSGLVTDRTKAYWPITILGYCVNLFAVPALALAKSWEWAALLIILERLGKAIRVTPRDAMLSHAASETSRGWAFGIHEAMDQIGAVLGPVLVSLVISFGGGYRSAFGVLLIPASIAISLLLISRREYPRPGTLEIPLPQLSKRALEKGFWVYILAASSIGAGYADFPLIAYHLKHTDQTPDRWIPIIYAIAMGTDGLSALLLGKLFDRYGMKILVAVCFITALFPPMVFLGGEGMVIFGMIIWGVGMGAQESILRAQIANMVSPEKRATGYGIFHTSFGISWFAGSAAMGLLYEVSLLGLVGLSMILQILAGAVILFGLSRSSHVQSRSL